MSYSSSREKQPQVKPSNENLFGTPAEPNRMLSRPSLRSIEMEPARSSRPSTYAAMHRVLSATVQPSQKAAAVIIQSKARSEWKDSIGKALCFIGGGLTIAGFAHLNPGLIAFGIICMLVGAAMIDKAAKELKEQAKANPAFFAKVDEKSVETTVFSPCRTGRQAVFR